MGAVMRHLQGVLGDDAIIANGAGNYTAWAHRFHRFRRFGSQVAPTAGSMGYGLPGAIAAKLCHPERTVIAFAGDGCFQMTGLEFATAVQEEAALIVLLVDNGMYGTIRMHQEMHYPGRVLRNRTAQPGFCPRWRKPAVDMASGSNAAKIFLPPLSEPRRQADLPCCI